MSTEREPKFKKIAIMIIRAYALAAMGLSLTGPLPPKPLSGPIHESRESALNVEDQLPSSRLQVVELNPCAFISEDPNLISYR